MAPETGSNFPILGSGIHKECIYPPLAGPAQDLFEPVRALSVAGCVLITFDGSYYFPLEIGTHYFEGAHEQFIGVRSSGLPSMPPAGCSVEIHLFEMGKKIIYPGEDQRRFFRLSNGYERPSLSLWK